MSSGRKSPERCFNGSFSTCLEEMSSYCMRVTGFDRRQISLQFEEKWLWVSLKDKSEQSMLVRQRAKYSIICRNSVWDAEWWGTWCSAWLFFRLRLCNVCQLLLIYREDLFFFYSTIRDIVLIFNSDAEVSHFKLQCFCSSRPLLIPPCLSHFLRFCKVVCLGLATLYVTCLH